MYLCGKNKSYAVKIERNTERTGHDQQGFRRASVKEAAVHKQRGTRQDKCITEDARENGGCP